jgi:hypothetical protein
MACPGRSPEVGAADLDIADGPPDRLLPGNTATQGAGYYPHFSHFGSSLRMPLSTTRITAYDIGVTQRL